MRAIIIPTLSIMLLASCTTVPRGPALSLAQAGQRVAGQSSSTIAGLADSVGSSVELQLVDSAITGQEAQSMNAPDNVKLGQSARRLADLIRLRADALAALGGAYAALEAETEFDQPGATSAAIDKLTKSATAFATAAAAASPAAGPAAALAGGVARLFAVEAAAAGQKQRLIVASRQINAANKLITIAIEQEAAVFAAVDASLRTASASYYSTLMTNNFISPTPYVDEFLHARGLTKASPPGNLVLPVALTVMNYRMWLAATAAADVYQAQIAALRALQAEHARFEEARPMTFENVELALGRLAGLAALLADLRAAEKGDSE